MSSDAGPPVARALPVPRKRPVLKKIELAFVCVLVWSRRTKYTYPIVPPIAIICTCRGDRDRRRLSRWGLLASSPCPEPESGRVSFGAAFFSGSTSMAIILGDFRFAIASKHPPAKYYSSLMSKTSRGVKRLSSPRSRHSRGSSVFSDTSLDRWLASRWSQGVSRNFT